MSSTEEMAKKDCNECKKNAPEYQYCIDCLVEQRDKLFTRNKKLDDELQKWKARMAKSTVEIRRWLSYAQHRDTK